jgi:hypothetical protein
MCVAKLIGAQFLSNIAEVTNEIPLEEPDHWIKLAEGVLRGL